MTFHHLLFIHGSFVAFAVTFAAFVLRCRLRVRAQAIWAMVLLVCFAKFYISMEFGGNAFSPEMSEAAMMVWNGAYYSAATLCILSLVTVFFRIPGRVWVLPTISVAIAVWGMYEGCAFPKTVEVTLEYPDLPKELDGYRIVQISDTHISAVARRERTRRIVDVANDLGADLTVMTGDIVDGTPDLRLRDVAPLKDLKAKDGVWFVTGNHEGYYNYPQWAPHYDRLGIKFLHNTWVEPRPGLVLAGIDDGRMLTEKVFAGAPKGGFRVLLSHRPRYAAANAELCGVRLQFSGHTHGGVMPGMAAIVKKYNGSFVRGLYRTSKMPEAKRSYVYVSPGSGQWAGFPVRYFNPTEITVFTLRRSPAS